MALPENRQKVLKILDVLNSRIIGQPHAGFTCSCGAVHSEPGVAIEIEPAGDVYPGQEVKWYLWSVRVSHHPEEPMKLGGFSCGITEFIPQAEVEALFESHFGTRPLEGSHYQLRVSRAERVYAKLLAAVKIRENKWGIFFDFDWGREQEIAIRMDTIATVSPRRALSGSRPFEAFFYYMEDLKDVTVYMGGPEPELAFESKWRIDFRQALEDAKSTNHLLLSNQGSSTTHKGTVYTDGRFTFLKVPAE